MSSGIVIRPAGVADRFLIADHRVRMFRDMGKLEPRAEAPLHEATARWLEGAIAGGEYFGWLAFPAGQPDRIVAGAGVQLRRILPFAAPGAGGGFVIGAGRQAIVVNVYTDPAWRRRGLARRLMHEVLGWARDAGCESLVLHAAPDGRPLYESLGFKPTNEMRFMGNLATWRAAATP